MSIEELKQNIKNMEKEKDELKGQAEALKKKIIQNIKENYANEIEKIVKNEVKNNPEKTKELGKEKISSMKKELNDTIKSLDSHVESIMSNKDYWLHSNCDSEKKSSYEMDRNATNAIEKGIREILGLAGKLLIKYEFCVVRSEYERYSTALFCYYGNNKNRVFYQYGTCVNKELDEFIKEYGKIVSKIVINNTKLLEEKRKLDEQEALNLWDEA